MPELDEPIHLVAYNADWPAQFVGEAQKIAAVLPVDVAMEHIGSTAVPGLLAKPIIDIMIGLQGHHPLADMRSALTGLGYEDMGEAGVPGRLHFRRRAEGDFNLAVVELGGPLWIANLALRDYLRANPRAAAKYAGTKRAAFDSGIRTLLAYSDYKKAIVAELIREALSPAK